MTQKGEEAARPDALVATLKRVAEGDRSAFQEIYRQTSPKLFGICLRICGERHAAEDVLQDVFITIWSRADRFDPKRAHPMTWLATIARNRAIDWRRFQGRTSTSTLDMTRDASDPAPLAIELISDRQDKARLETCFDTLEHHISDAIRSAFLDGLTYAELAVRAAVPLATMKSRIRRGLQKLKACLGYE